MGVGVGGLQIQTAAIGHQRAVGAVTEEDIGGRGAVHDLLYGDQIRIHADPGGGGQLVIVVADVDLLLFRVFADVEVAGGFALTLGVAGDIQGTAHGAGGYAGEVYAAALDAGGVIFNGAAGESKIDGELGGGHVPVCPAADGTAVLPGGVVLHGAAAYGDAAQGEQGSVVKKGVDDPHSADKRQHKAQLVKTQPHRYAGDLKQQHRVEQHHDQAGKIIFRKRDHRHDI